MDYLAKYRRTREERGFTLIELMIVVTIIMILLGMAAVMVIPSLMPFLSLVLPTRVNRWVNIVFGAVYSVIMILVIRGGWHFYILYGLIEITLTLLIVWYAWTWPKQPTR